MNDSINQFNEIYIFSNLNNSSNELVNQKLYSKSNGLLIEYYLTTHLVTLNDLLSHLDCLQTIDLMKRRIHFNLLLQEQIDQFFVKCRKLEF